MLKLIRILFFVSIVRNSIGNVIPIEVNFPGDWICSGLKQGTQLPHPEDCSAYFVCDFGSPTMIRCEQQLHYDRRLKVCNWPDHAKCVLGEYPKFWNETKPFLPTIQLPIPLTSSSSTPPFELSSTDTSSSAISEKEQTSSPELLSTTSSVLSTTSQSLNGCVTSPWVTAMPLQSSNSTTGAKDDHGNAVNPLEKFNPVNVQCFHNGLYFLPHPANCQKYFICSNHVLYLHECGVGVSWNYKLEQCEIMHISKCFNYDAIMSTSTPNVPLSTKKRKPNNQSRPWPTANSQTVEEVTSAASTNPSTEIELIPECPGKEQKFLPHPRDCTKYYICIAGMPALTSCPHGLYWDERENWCSDPEFSYCHAALKNN